MKKIFILSVLIFCALTVKAQFFPKAMVKYSFNENYTENCVTDSKLIPNLNGGITTLPDNKISLPHLSIKLGAEYKYHKLSAYFNNTIWIVPQGLTKYQPEIEKFDIGLNFYVTDKIKLNFEHCCIHNIETPKYINNHPLTGGYNQISISYGY